MPILFTGAIRSGLIFITIASAICALAGAIYYAFEDFLDGVWGNSYALGWSLKLVGLSAILFIIGFVLLMQKLNEHKKLQSRASNRILKNKPFQYACGLAVGYILLSGLYIVFSTQLAWMQSISADNLKAFELLKGSLFIGVTGLLLFVLIYFLLRKITLDAQEIVMQKEALIEAGKRATAGIFAASVAHDAGNILTSLRFCLELFSRENDQALKPSSMELLNNMNHAIKELSTLNRRLVETGKCGLDNHLANQEIIAEIKGALSFVRANQRVKYCQVDLEGDARLEAYVDMSLINETLINLVLNAADATDNEGKILVMVYALNNHVHLEVHDNGPGIPKSQIEQIFDPFYTTKPEGSGLGLLMVKACAEIHRGSIQVGRSPRLGGAVFSITFPITKN